MDSDYRSFALRRHRILAHYLSSYCWRKNVDCVWIDRAQLATFLQLERFKSERLEWIQDDVRFLFPHTYASEFEDSLSEMFFSRIPFEHLPLPVRTEDQYIRNYTSMFPGIWKNPRNSDDPKIRQEYLDGLEEFISYSDRALDEKIKISKRAVYLDRKKSECSEASLLAILSLGLAGLDDSRGYEKNGA